MAAAELPALRILVVDDEPLVCDAIKMMLAFDGHRVETASTGSEALKVYEKEEFDVVFTDFSMPGMKGDELAALIRARSPGQPIVMITAYAEMLQAEVLEGAKSPLASVDCVVSKPFLMDSLRDAIVRVLQKRGFRDNW